MWAIDLLLSVFCLSIRTLASQKAFSNGLSFQEYTERSLLWAPYRPNCYFGLRPRNVDANEFQLGIMWFDNSRAEGLTRLRHFVDEGDHLRKYGWEIYDPRLGGREVIIDDENNLNLTIYFTKSHNGQNWGIRLHGRPIDSKKKTTASIILYMNQAGENEHSKLVKIDSEGSKSTKFQGASPELGEYEISLNLIGGRLFKDPALSSMKVAPGCDSSKTSHISMRVPDDSVWKAKDIFQTLLTDSVSSLLKFQPEDVPVSLIPSIFTVRNVYDLPVGNFHFLQNTFDNSDSGGFELDVIYNKLPASEKINSSEDISNLISNTLNGINAKFNKHFRLDSEDEQHHRFAMETLSNLLGGIGYFHGKQLVDRVTELDEDTFKEVQFRHPEEEGPLSIFASVPSRAVFPRGFYWDEGFHLLQIMNYDFDLAVEICLSWFDLIEDSGWIAREVILGNEARSKVPDRFAVQNPHIANPPTLLLAFSEMLGRAIEKENQSSMNGFGSEQDNGEKDNGENNQLETNHELLISYAEKIYPKLLRHYNWFRRSQRSSLSDYLDVLEEDGILDKVHVNETYRWRGRTKTHCLPSGMDDYPRAQPPDDSELDVDALTWVGVMTRSMRQIAHILGLEKDEQMYSNIESQIVENLDILHWSEGDGHYCDVTVGGEWDDSCILVCHTGYVSILPFALKLIPQGSPRLGRIVSLLSDSNKLFSDYGILSLARDDEYFGRGENYWRGPIWMNINYLILDALKFYYPEVVSRDKKSPTEARKLYQRLKQNLIKTVFHNWQEKGYCYEQFNPNTGEGQGVEHFTGWTALVVNIMGHD